MNCFAVTYGKVFKIQSIPTDISRTANANVFISKVV